METILLVVQVILAVGIIGLVLFQRSDNDGFGMGSGSGMGLVSGRAKANLLTRSTAVLAALFMLNSLFLSIVSAERNENSLLDRVPTVVEEEVQEEEVAPDMMQVPAADIDATEGDAPAAEGTDVPKIPADAVPDEPTVPKAE